MNKIFLILLFCLAVTSALLAQDTSYYQIKKTITIGFQTGVQYSKYPNQFQNSKTNYQTTNRLLARKKLTHHFDIETGIDYTVIPMGESSQPIISNRYGNRGNQISVPLSIQYNFLPETNKLRPYISVGGIYDLIKTSYPVRTQVYSDGSAPSIQNTNGNKYVGVVVAQGFIYEVNTKIQFNECMHFIQQNNCKTVGIDFGVGYKIN